MNHNPRFAGPKASVSAGVAALLVLALLPASGCLCGPPPIGPPDASVPDGASRFRNEDPDVFTAASAMASDVGPWLSWVRGDAAHTHLAVSWGRSLPHRPVFRLGKSPGALTDLVVSNDESRRHHTFVAENLLPETTYFYRVDDESGAVLIPESPLRTAPAPDSKSAFHFFYTGDTRPRTTNPLDDAELRATAGALASDPDLDSATFVLNAGDLVDRGRAEDWKNFLGQYWGPIFAKVPVLTAPGNHDYDEWNTSIGPTQSYFKDVFAYPDAESYYQVQVGRALFLVLDTGWTTAPAVSDLSFRSGQLEFLDSRLEAARAAKTAGALDFVFLVLHDAIASCGMHGDDPYGIAIREQLRPRIDAGGIDFLLTSHDHVFQRNSWEGLQVFVNGTGGAYRDGTNGAKHPDKAPAGLVNHFFTNVSGYARVDVDGKDATFTYRQKDHTPVDLARYRLVTVTYRNPRGWTQARMRFANAFEGDAPTWTGPKGRPMTPNADGSFRLTVPVLQHGSGEFRLRCSFVDGANAVDGAAEVDDDAGAMYATSGDDPVIVGRRAPGP